MAICFAALSDSDFFPDPKDNIMDSLFHQYERVIIESLISSFGLDFLIKDQYGGDVDTIHNVRQIGDGVNSDPNMKYKNKANEANYQNRGTYDRAEYHENNATYSSIRKEAKKEFNENGVWIEDVYTSSKLGISKALPNEKRAELDHIISGKSHHDDQGRVLAGISGSDLANQPDNLRFTNMKLNNNMRDKDIPEYIKWCEDNPDKVNWNGIRGEPLPDDVKKKLMSEYERSKKASDTLINRTYYTSTTFLNDTVMAAGTVGLQMGIRQTIGLIFTEIWFSVREEFENISTPFQLDELLTAIGNGIKKGFINAQSKYKDLINRFKDGAIAGILASITTTLCNIFFTTAKNIVRIIRQSYASLVQAAEILFLNPDNYLFGERMRAVSKIIATGASVVVGTVVSEAIRGSGIDIIPDIGDIVSSFCGTFVTGILSCSLLYFLDRSETMNRLVSVLNKVPSMSSEVEYFKRQAVFFEHYAAEIMQIDTKKFKEEADMYLSLASELETVEDENNLNILLRKATKLLGITIPWGDDFNSFMTDKDAVLVFE